MGTKVIKCVCINEYQDKKYGEQKRVHNIGGTKDEPTYTCTVCGKKKNHKHN